MPYPEYKSDLSYCRRIHRHYGKSFYFGTLLLSKDERDATCVLYAFFRLPDEYVDTEHQASEGLARNKLENWRDQWGKCLKGEDYQVEENEAKVFRSAKYVFDKFSIPVVYSDVFISAMIQDTHKKRYDTYDELRGYMYGSASVVGLMMTYVMCAKDDRFINDSTYRELVLKRADALGVAFQMTNFLRDINEDLVERGRVYIPQEDMLRFGVTEEGLKSKIVNEEFISMMKSQIKRTRDVYLEADKGIEMLPPRARKGIWVARVLYSGILDKIETCGYNIFDTRVHLGFGEKLSKSLVTLVKN